MLAPTSKQNVISTGNETFDKFLGGGLLNATLNLFERQGPSSRIVDVIVNKSIAAATLTEKNGLIYVNFNTSLKVQTDYLLSSLPSQRKVKSELLYKDIQGKSGAAKIKIAWRYSNRGTSSPSDGVAKMNQIDFGVPIMKTTEPEDLGKISVVNVDQGGSIDEILNKIRQAILDMKKTHQTVNIIIKDLLHPFSPLIGREANLLKFMYLLRCLSRLLNKGAILVCYDLDLCDNHFNIKQQLYNIADCAVLFHSYETDENILTGYKDIDGTMIYIKVPKINSFGFHFQQDLSDWGYRLTRNLRYFVVDELSLPPCEDDDNERKGRQIASDVTKIENIHRPLEQVGPLEEFREVAHEVITKKL